MKHCLTRYVRLCMTCLMTLLVVGCTTADDDNKKESQSTPVIQNFNEEAPQYYMSNGTAAAANGYYYICGEPISTNSYHYLYFYEYNTARNYPVCSNAVCDHSNEKCDAHTILNNIIYDSIWYYKGRLYMVERTEEYDQVISYDLTGRDRKNHTKLNVDGFVVWDLQSSMSMCFNDGYVYYITNNALQPSLYRVSISDGSTPELLKTYDNSKGETIKIRLSAITGRVFINFEKKDVDTGVSTYLLDGYDTENKKMLNIMETDSNAQKDIFGWTKVLFDNRKNMYYVTITDTEYIINRLDTITKKTEKFYTIQCNNLGKSSMAAARDADYIYMQLCDDECIYVSVSVNGLKNVAEFEPVTLKYGTNDSKTLVTDANTNYIYVVALNGKCENVISLKEAGIRENAKRRQGMIVPRYICGKDGTILVSINEEYKIENYELTNEKYLNRLEEIKKKDPSLTSLRANTILLIDNASVSDNIMIRNLANEYNNTSLKK